MSESDALPRNNVHEPRVHNSSVFYAAATRTARCLSKIDNKARARTRARHTGLLVFASFTVAYDPRCSFSLPLAVTREIALRNEFQLRISANVESTVRDVV